MYGGDNHDISPGNPNFANGWNNTVTDFMAPNAAQNMHKSLVSYWNNIDVLVCPSVKAKFLPDAAFLYRSRTTYMGNAVCLERKLTVVPNPSEIVFAQEINVIFGRSTPRPYKTRQNENMYAAWHWKAVDGPGVGAPLGLPLPGMGPWTDQPTGYVMRYAAIHNQGGEFIFADGHAEYRKLTALRAKHFGLTTPAGQTGDWGEDNVDSPRAPGTEYSSSF